MILSTRSVPMVGATLMLLCVAASADDRDSTPRTPCPYETAHTTALDSKIEPVDATDQYERLRVEFNGIKRDRVPGYLYLPKNDRPKRPAVLLQYGIGGDKKVDYIVNLGQQFVEHGYTVLTIDSPGRGERKSAQATKRAAADWLVGTEGRDLFLQYCGDYSRAVDYLVDRSDVDPNQIAYVGISWGAITGIPYVAHDTRIKAMGSMVGGGNFLGQVGVNNSDDPAPKDRPKLVSIDPVHHVAMIAPRPLLLLNVTKDQLVPRPFADALHEAAGRGAKKMWLETDHYFNGVDRHAVGESVIQFIDQSLPPP